MDQLVVEKVVGCLEKDEHKERKNKAHLWFFLYHYHDGDNYDLRDVNYEFYSAKSKKDAYYKFITDKGSDMLKHMLQQNKNHVAHEDNIECIYCLWEKLKEKEDQKKVKEFIKINLDLIINFIKKCDPKYLKVEKIKITMSN